MTNLVFYEDNRRSHEDMVRDVRRLGEKLIREAEDIVGNDPDLGQITIEFEIDRYGGGVSTNMYVRRASYIYS